MISLFPEITRVDIDDVIELLLSDGYDKDNDLVESCRRVIALLKLVREECKDKGSRNQY